MSASPEALAKAFEVCRGTLPAGSDFDDETMPHPYPCGLCEHVALALDAFAAERVAAAEKVAQNERNEHGAFLVENHRRITEVLARCVAAEMVVGAARATAPLTCDHMSELDVRAAADLNDALDTYDAIRARSGQEGR